MSGVPERDLVDKALQAARSSLLALGERDRQVATVNLYLAEALVRQIRDADDTQYEIAQRIEAGFADLGVILGSIDIPRPAEPHKKGLFS